MDPDLHFSEATGVARSFDDGATWQTPVEVSSVSKANFDDHEWLAVDNKNPNSPFYDEALLARGIGIRFAGQEKTNVEEYCVSEGWVRVAAGKALDRKGNPLTIKLKGPVEPYFRAASET